MFILDDFDNKKGCDFIMNNKGQALIEFVLILPIFIFMLLIVIDFGIIFNEKNKIENDSLDIINLYKNDESIDKIKEIYRDNEIIISSLDGYDKVSIKTNVKLITPGLGRIFGNPYVIKVERVIPNA